LSGHFKAALYNMSLQHTNVMGQEEEDGMRTAKYGVALLFLLAAVLASGLA
jgi:hypothetical protein